MGQAIDAVEQVGAVAVAGASAASARNGRLWREKRLRFLGALREATGDAGALGDALDGEDAPLPVRARIADAQAHLRLIEAVLPDTAASTNVDVAAIVREMADSGARSVAIQARLGIATVKSLVAANAVNGA